MRWLRRDGSVAIIGPGAEMKWKKREGANPESLIPVHGGYRNLKSFRLGQLIYDVTVRFGERYVERRSRTHDQMVQAARSGPQNIAEGSMASATSKKTELKLTSVARASLEELRLDYEDFLRQRGMELWDPQCGALRRFKARRCATLEQLRTWAKEERSRARTNTDKHGRTGAQVVSVRVCRCPSSAEIVANGALSLLNLCCYLLDRQLESLAASFEREGGFTERLYRIRTSKRKDSAWRK